MNDEYLYKFKEIDTNHFRKATTLIYINKFIKLREPVHLICFFFFFFLEPHFIFEEIYLCFPFLFFSFSFFNF